MSEMSDVFVFKGYGTDLGKRRNRDPVPFELRMRSEPKPRLDFEMMARVRRAFIAAAAERRRREMEELLASLDCWKLAFDSDQVQEALDAKEPEH